jgi:hypothetical protein
MSQGAKIMKKLLVLALILVAANSFAQTSNMPNSIGIYFDTSGTNNTLMSAPLYTPVSAYVVATNINLASSIAAFEFGLAYSVAPVGLGYTYPSSAFANVLSPPDFQAGIAPALPVAPAMVLTNISFLNMGAPLLIAMGPCNPTSFPVSQTPGAVDGADFSHKFPLFLVATSMPTPAKAPNFYYMAGFMTPGPVIPQVVATENDSWGSVKSLYQ